MFVTSTVITYGIPLVLVLAVVIKLVQLFQRRLHYQKILEEFPGPEAHWLTGNGHKFNGSDIKSLKETAEVGNQFGGVFPLWFGPFEVTLLVVNPNTAKTVLTGSDPKDEFSYALLGPWLGEGLLLASGPKWERNRQLLTPAFHADIMKDCCKTFAKTLDRLVNKLETEHQLPQEMFAQASRFTMDSMLQCLFGHDSQCQNERNRHPYVQAVCEVSELIVRRLSNPLHMVDFIYRWTNDGKKFKAVCDDIHAFSKKVIADRKRLLETETPGSRPLDFLDILLTARDSSGQGLNDTEIQAEVDTFMFAGHDSTASSLSWCLYNLAAHPESQEACRREAAKILDDREQFEWDDLKKMDMISACIQESMRLFPAVPNLSRFTKNEIHLQDGRTIPAGLRVGVSVFAMHRNPEFWNDPETYNPTRFLDSGKDALINGYMPFSIGPRNCIGRIFAQVQLKMAVATIVTRFRLHIIPDRLPVPESNLILRSKNGLYLRIEKI